MPTTESAGYLIKLFQVLSAKGKCQKHKMTFTHPHILILRDVFAVGVCSSFLHFPFFHFIIFYLLSPESPNPIYFSGLDRDLCFHKVCVTLIKNIGVCTCLCLFLMSLQSFTI